jgi:hypothetical protein
MSRKSIAFFKLPHPHYNIASSLPKRGREEGIFLKRGNRGKILTEGCIE